MNSLFRHNVELAVRKMMGADSASSFHSMAWRDRDHKGTSLGTRELIVAMSLPTPQHKKWPPVEMHAMPKFTI